MKTNYLFPYVYKKMGWFIFIPSIILGICLTADLFSFDFLDITVFSIAELSFMENNTNYFSFVENNISDEIASSFLIIGALLIAFSKERYEDEFISKIRLESLVWATYINYAILILSIVFVYEFAFFWVLVFNMFTLLIFFIIRFNWLIYKSKNQIQDEE